MRGCPTISYGWGRGHIRANNEAFRRYGFAEVAASQTELGSALGARCTPARPARARARLAAVGGLARSRARGVRADWFLPGAGGARRRALARAYGIDRRLAPRRRGRTDVRRRPASPTGRPPCSRSSRARGATATFFLVGEQVRAAAVACARDRRGRPRGSACTATGTRCCCGARVRALADDLDRARRDDRRGDRRARRRSTGRRTASSAPARSLMCARAAGGRSSGRPGAATGSAARRRRRSRAARRRRLRPGDVVLLHDSDAYSSAGSWRRTAAALPSVLDAVASSRRARVVGHPLDVAANAVGERSSSPPSRARARGALARDVAAAQVAGAALDVDDRHVADDVAHGARDRAHARRSRGRRGCRRGSPRRGERRDDAIGEVLDVDEPPRLRAVAGDRQRLARERLGRERGTTAVGRERGPYGMPKRRIVCSRP